MQFLLSRELALVDTVRLWDTYIALDVEKSEASIASLLDFHLYVCIAVLEPWQEMIESMQSEEIKQFLQQMPPMDMGQIITKAGYLQKEVEAKQLL